MRRNLYRKAIGNLCIQFTDIQSWPEDHETLSDLSQKFSQS